MNKERRLGRGLEALLGRPVASEPASVAAEAPQSAAGADGLLRLAVGDIDRNPYQPRQDFDETAIAELAASLTQHGLIQPIIVRRAGDHYQLIAGERRLRAAVHAGWTHVPAQVREADDRQVAEVAIVENLQRRDLGALEKAASFQDYLQRYQCTQEELAGRLGIDRSTIANLIRLLELPQAIQDSLRAGAISQGHARALLPLGDEREQLALCRRIETETLSVRATEALVQEMVQETESLPLGIVTGESAGGGRKRRPSAHVASLEQELRSALGTKVELKQSSKGRGKIVIHFTSHDEFERLRGQLSDRHRQSQVG